MMLAGEEMRCVCRVEAGKKPLTGNHMSVLVGARANKEPQKQQTKEQKLTKYQTKQNTGVNTSVNVDKLTKTQGSTKG